MTSNIRIKKVAYDGNLSEENFKILEDLDNRIFGYRYHRGFKKGTWWILFDGDKPIGYCGVFLDYGDDFGWLGCAGVIKSYRGMGLQKKMIRVREKEARKHGLKKLITYTSRDNFPSANNLIRCGYLLYQPETEYGVKNALYFFKEL